MFSEVKKIDAKKKPLNTDRNCLFHPLTNFDIQYFKCMRFFPKLLTQFFSQIL